MRTAHNFKDLTGKRFGKLIVEKDSTKRQFSRVIWICQCDCGNTTEVNSGSLLSSHTKSCGCGQADGVKLPKGEGAKRTLYRTYKWNANDRELDFSLSLTEFSFLTQQNCHYCGVSPNQIAGSPGHNGHYTYNGIDRIDNNQGYNSLNCITACGNCNKAKSVLGYKQFQDWLNQIREKK